MIALKVRLNYQLLTIAGAEDLSVLSAILSGSVRDGVPQDHHFRLHVGGLSRSDASGQAEHREWSSPRNLTVGDFLTVEIVEADEASPVVERRPAKRSLSSKEGADVITLLSHEYLLLLHASRTEGIDLNEEDLGAVLRANRLIELGLLTQREEKVFASDLGLAFLNHNETESEFVHRYRVPRE
ncbi:hypothetical protein [Planctomyces sp. SH-PL14]|uniref:hypothetical protein n=1 Tax=Planctomyces sp. SH-PL14 TaxID=1632864 RepID=UPI00078DB091|nr:hypothetical protein [Planctomyces sp. SH-PL14]AMV22495.1 hypothetical protein VT03_31660 [Planctomyces sp. SH-PL14]